MRLPADMTRGGIVAVVDDIELAGNLADVLNSGKVSVQDAITESVLFGHDTITLPIKDAALLAVDLGSTRDLLERIASRG